MNRDDAQKLIGSSVSAWTAANGTYSGTLEDVLFTKGRPWRGRVRVTGVLQVAQHFENGRVCRRGFRIGEEIELGGINIKPFGGTNGVDYKTALERSIEVLWQRFHANPEGRGAWACKATAEAEQIILLREIHRLNTGEWITEPLQAGKAASPKPHTCRWCQHVWEHPIGGMCPKCFRFQN